MRKVAFRGLFARKLRLFLTALAIALGVTLIAGTYVFTDTINASFDRIFEASNKHTDASITPREGVTNDQGTRPTVPPSVLAKVRAQPDVAAAQGTVFDIATVFDAKGHKIGATGSPSFVGSVAEIARFRTTTTKQGRFPRTRSEAVIDAASAQREGIRLGDRIAVQGVARKTTYTVVGTAQVAGVDSFGGTTVVDLVLPEAQRVLGKRGFDQIQAASKPGVTPERLAAALRQALPPAVTVRTGQEQTAKDQRDIRGQLGFLTTALLAFAGISLFVGAFIIFNTFSITVTQRIREFALLRTLGASRGQVMRSVLGEGVALGVLGSAIGLGLGLITAIGLRALFAAIGVELPSSSTVIATRTILVSLVVGTLVTLASSFAPALRATRVPPVEALREGAAPTAKGPSRVTTGLATLLTALGVALMCLGLFGHRSETAALSLMGGGVAATFLGVALLSPYLVRPIASAIGRPIQRLTGITGRLARENTVRQPGRTAVTAAALMIGVTLVTFASIFAAGARDSIAKAVDQNLTAGLIVQSSDGFSPFSAGALREVAQVPGVGRVSPVRFSLAEGRGPSTGLGKPSVTGIDPATFRSLYEVKILQGGDAAVRALTTGRVALAAKTFAEDHHLHAGSRLLLRTPSNAVVPVRISGVYDDKGGLLANLTLDNRQLARDFGETKDAFGLVGIQAGQSLQAVERRVKAALDRDYPATDVLTGKEFKDQQAGQVNQLLGLIYALLSLAIIVSLFGIVNTLVLSISERTRELGMLRAIGTSRKQIKRMIRWEAVITSLIGGVLGAVLGTILAVLFTRPLDGFVLSIPVPTLVVLLILAGFAGVLAAVLPARRAARLDVLDALAYE
jgi:putative ABC transport system permease protein